MADPNPVVVLEHKGLYWSKVPGTEAAKTVEPDEEYRPLGLTRVVQTADGDHRPRAEHCDLRSRRALGARGQPRWPDQSKSWI